MHDRKPLTEAEVRALLAAAPGVKIVDDRAGNKFPEPIAASGPPVVVGACIHIGAGQDLIFVGRIRPDPTQPKGHGYEVRFKPHATPAQACSSLWPATSCSRAPQPTPCRSPSCCCRSDAAID